MAELMGPRIALDAMGGDSGPAPLVSGALQAVNDNDHLSVSLVGDAEQLCLELARIGAGDDPRLTIVPAAEVVEMGEKPMDALRRKRDSSIMVAFKEHKAGRVDGVVSAGNSGATMAAAIRCLGRLPGVVRPGIAGPFPTLRGPVLMMDVGANVDCRPRHLFQFGVMASVYHEVCFGTASPRVGLLSIGEERGKGNTLVRRTHDLLQASDLNYIGNIEGGDIFSGDIDVVVCDGFVGNVCLKVSEGLAEALGRMLGDELSRDLSSRLGYFMSRKAFARFKKRVDYAEYGGAPLLGLKGCGIICHGKSNSRAVKNAIDVAADMVGKDVVGRIRSLLAAGGLAPGPEMITEAVVGGK